MRVLNPVLHPYIRSKAKLHQTPLDRFQVRIAKTVKEHEDAFRLVRVGYAFQGIVEVGHCDDMWITNQHVLPESTIFVAYEEEKIVGTMTVTLDSSAGLPIDKEYPMEVDTHRDRGAILVEFGSLAVVRRCWSAGVTTLLNFAAHWFSRHVLKATHCVIEVNPKAAPHYQALYAFTLLGAPKQHRELDAPTQGLIQEIPAMRSFMKRHYRKQLADGFHVYQRICDELPPCIELPPVKSLHQMVRWKLPRSVFRELFINKSNRLETLNAPTKKRLKEWRTNGTTRLCAIPH